MDLTLDSLAVCVECGVLTEGDHPCESIPPTETDCLGATVQYLLRGEMIRARADRNK